MKILRLDVTNFTVLKNAGMVPSGDVVLVSEPGSGRISCMEGIKRSQACDLRRMDPPEDSDISIRDTNRRFEGEVTLGELWQELGDVRKVPHER